MTLVVFSFIFSDSVTAQDNALKAAAVKSWQVGLYKTEKAFLRKEPSESKAFSISPVYAVKNKDSVLVGYKYNYLDSSPRMRWYYGLFDGKDFYLRVKFDLLQKFDHLGKYPFITLIKGGDFPFSSNLAFLAIALAENLLAGVNEEIWYFNKNGTFLQATKQAMFFLLRDEKDLYSQFAEEKVYNNNVFRKYLLKMNERYPD